MIICTQQDCLIPSETERGHRRRSEMRFRRCLPQKMSAGKKGFSVGMKNEGGIHIITRLCKHATRSSVRVCDLSLDSGGQRAAVVSGSS